MVICKLTATEKYRELVQKTGKKFPYMLCFVLLRFVSKMKGQIQSKTDKYPKSSPPPLK